MTIEASSKRLLGGAAAALCISILCSGCSGRPFSMVPSTSPLPTYVRGTIPADGDDCQYRLLGLLPVTGAPNTQTALQEAKDSAQSEVLTDVTIDETGAYFILFSNTCIHVRGLGVPRTVTERLRAVNMPNGYPQARLHERESE